MTSRTSPGGVIDRPPRPGIGNGGGSDRVKISLNMLDSDLRALRQWAADDGTSMTEIIRRALGTLRYLQREVAAGRRIVLRTEGQPDKEVVLSMHL